jgi:hypothetical protein
MTPMRTHTLVGGIASAALLIAGCSSESQPAEAGAPSVVAEGEEVGIADTGPLLEATARVTAAHQGADQQLAGVVAAARELDRIVAALREPASTRSAREAWPEVDAAFDRAETEGLRERYIELASAADDARTILRELAVEASEDSPEAAYLEAEDASLAAVRDYAESTDILVRALLTHWETYARIRAATASFVGERWAHRDGEEAADAYEVAIGRHVRGLGVAQEEIEAALDQREVAAAAVNESADRAVALWTEVGRDGDG